MTEPIQYDDTLWFHFSTPFQLLGTWKESLGSIRTENFLKSNFLIFAMMPSQNIEILDGENKSLAARVKCIYHSLLLQGVARHRDEAFVITGANKEGKIEARSVAPLYPRFDTWKVISKSIDDEIIRNAVKLSEIIDCVYADKKKHVRLKDGFRITIDLLREYIALERLHQSVRALEALMKPQIGATKRQFIHRCQTFGGRSDDARKIYDEIFELRSREEHLNEIDDILEIYGKGKLDYMIFLRACQSELLVEHAYLSILRKDTIRKFFEDDNSIEAFWKMADDERYRLWGDPLDIVNAIAERSDFFVRP